MRKLLLYPGFLFLLVACGEENTSDPLHQPPYDRITDSIEEEPANAALYFRRATMLYLNKQTVFAEKDLRKAWQLDPRELYAVSLTELLKEKNIDSNINFIRSAMKKLPESIELRLELAEAYSQKGSLAEVLSTCDSILGRHPGQLDALEMKAEALEEMDRPDEAISVLETAYNYAPGDVAIVHALAFSYAETKNPKTLKLADSLIRMDVQQKHAEPYYFKGVYFYHAGNFTEAIRQFDKAIQHDFYFIDAYMNKGLVYYDQKKYGQALNTFMLAIKVQPTYAQAYYWVGRVHEAMGNKEEARLDYQRAYGLDKSFTLAKEAAERLQKI